ncbi:MAG: hypothetical protein H6923_06400 [Alphaproteobacteria bacterium]|nr:hypothetical protein [Alphaproteobacteria bacterium]
MHILNRPYLSRLLAGTAIAVLCAPSLATAYDAGAASAAAAGAACDDARPFYWEIGGVSGSPIVSGQVGGTTYGRTTTVGIASASKFIFGAYVVERYGGIPGGASGAEMVKALNMKSGYTSFNPVLCVLTTKVSTCFTIGSNDVYDSDADGEFVYGGGHAQYISADSGLLNLGNKTKTTLMTEINSQLGLGSSFAFNTPGLAGGMEANAADYAAFLQNVMNGTYELSNYLGYGAVATTPCAEGLEGCSPFGDVDVHYSLHHWVEDDSGGELPNGADLNPGDGSFSSAGANGFYPWISADQAYYGIISRQATGGALDSVVCGRAIREAFLEE